MANLSAPRISGRALRALVPTVKATPLKHALVGVLRAQLGIDAVRALAEEYRGPLPVDQRPTRARSSHARASLGLGLPPAQEWPRTNGSYARAYAEGTARPLDVARKALAFARDLGARTPSLGPLVAYDDERALAAAEESAARFARGAARELEGVPVVIKEEVDVQGLVTRLGTGWIRGAPAREDCPAVARLRQAGAVVLGHSPMTEYGMSPLGQNPHRVMPRNPHDERRLAGGSSTGSGVAVATGVAPMALGVDGGGSIRIPAVHNGVFGLKPTFGRIPMAGSGTGTGSTVGHAGPLGASCHDLAAFLQACGGADDRDPASVGQPPLEGLEAALGRGVRGLTVGIDEAEWAVADPELARAARDALRALEADGARLVDVRIGLAARAPAIGYLTIALETLVGLRSVLPIHGSEFGLDLQLMLAGLEAFRSDDYLDAQRLRATLRRQVAEALRSVDLLALPTVARSAPRATEEEAREGFVDSAAIDAACRFAFLGNLTGVPCGTAPVGVDREGLPLGVQLVGDAWDEACVLQAMAHLERAGVARVVRPRSADDLLA
ncbi:MAG: amidase [Polyangiaceae bacterium]|nr:amidase [Polyangiaceae bacterium]